jgi:Domain of unknown function (DUF1707)
MAGPGDGMAAGAGGRGHLRASHADREQVIGTLKAAFVHGRLAKDEFDLRVGQALASRTYAQLAPLTADLPAGLTTARPPKPARARGERRVLRPGQVKTAATVLYAGMWALASVLPSNDGEPRDGLNLVGLATLVYLLVFVWACVWAQAVGSRREKRSGGQLPPAGPGHQRAAEAAQRRLPRQPLPGSGLLRRRRLVELRGHRACCPGWRC